MATIRQKRAIIEVVKGSNISQAMRKVGYSKETAKRTNKLTASTAWPELMEKYLPDLKLAQVHAEGLDATKIKTSLTEPDLEVADYPTRHKYLETGYKIKNRIKGEDYEETPIQIDQKVLVVINKIYGREGD